MSILADNGRKKAFPVTVPSRHPEAELGPVRLYDCTSCSHNNWGADTLNRGRGNNYCSFFKILPPLPFLFFVVNLYSVMVV